jgi:peptidoglycan/xylan/chitin deacetylase (PgdA/CDA1 family)
MNEPLETPSMPTAPPHGVMFHHFHGGRHPVGQGSLSAAGFAAMLDWLEDRYSLLSASEYIRKLASDALEPGDISLTFDDGLSCQSDIAVPVLNARGLQAFFFVYSSPFRGGGGPLEVYRYFRTVAFGSVKDFYREFDGLASRLFEAEYRDASARYVPGSYRKESPFYTEQDRWFRSLRDHVLGGGRYDTVMSALMAEHRFDARGVGDRLWMKDADLRRLEGDGHVIGLHSYSHPTMLHTLPVAEQYREYQANMAHLVDTLAHPPISMAHPCGNYSRETLGILEGLGIQVGFRSSMGTGRIESALEIPRTNHVTVLAAMTPAR